MKCALPSCRHHACCRILACLSLAACGGAVGGSNKDADIAVEEDAGFGEASAESDGAGSEAPDPGEDDSDSGEIDGTSPPAPQDASLADSDIEGGWSGPSGNDASGPPLVCGAMWLACGVAFPGSTPFATAQEAANALVGRWSFCGSNSNGFYPSDQLGEEFAADGNYYQLIMGSNGQLQRNLDPVTIGSWKVQLRANNVLAIHTYGDGIQRNGGLSACPPSLITIAVETRIP